MKKYINSLLLSALVATGLSADPVTFDDSYAKEFAKMNQYFDSLVASHFNNARFNNFNYPRMDIKDSPKEIVLKFDLAGVPKENIKLTIDDHNILTLKGSKKTDSEKKSENMVQKEIFYGNFERQVQLPDNIEQDKLSTQYKDGILTVKIGKKKVIKPKAKIIPIK